MLTNGPLLEYRWNFHFVTKFDLIYKQLLCQVNLVQQNAYKGNVVVSRQNFDSQLLHQFEIVELQLLMLNLHSLSESIFDRSWLVHSKVIDQSSLKNIMALIFLHSIREVSKQVIPIGIFVTSVLVRLIESVENFYDSSSRLFYNWNHICFQSFLVSLH